MEKANYSIFDNLVLASFDLCPSLVFDCVVQVKVVMVRMEMAAFIMVTNRLLVKLTKSPCLEFYQWVQGNLARSKVQPVTANCSQLLLDTHSGWKLKVQTNTNLLRKSS